MDKLQNALQPSFTYEDLAKIVIFKMNEKTTNISANDFKFKFTIEGILNKDIASEEIRKEFELSEVDTKADCLFSIEANKVASLSCDLNVEKHKNIETFSFKTAEIKTNNNEIYLAKFNDIVLLNSKEKEEDDDKNKTLIIVVSVVCGVIGLAGISVGVYFLVKYLKSKTMKLNVDENKENRETNNKNIRIEELDSGNRVSTFRN